MLFGTTLSSPGVGCHQLQKHLCKDGAVTDIVQVWHMLYASWCIPLLLCLSCTLCGTVWRFK